MLINIVENKAIKKQGKENESIGEARMLLLIQNVRKRLFMRNEGARPVGSTGKSEPGKCNSKCKGSGAEMCLDHSRMSKEASVG